MAKVLVINSEEGITKDIETAIGKINIGKSIKIVAIPSVEQAVEFLNYELPDITILNFADENLDMYNALEKINEDPWLHVGCLIPIHAMPSENEFLKTLRNSNIVSVISAKQLKHRLGNVVRIVLQNNDIIFQRDLQQTLTTRVDGAFIIDNDPFDANVFASILSNYLFYSNMINFDDRDNVKMALVELLMNAIEHGNCIITFDEKTEGMMQGLSIFELIAEKKKDPEIANRKVLLNYTIREENSVFCIIDEGAGFDWRKAQKLLDTDLNEALAHGRGIFMTSQSVHELHYNDKGNEVTFEILHQKDQTNLRPQIFEGRSQADFKPGDIVFQKGEESNFLYYIVSGTYEVLDDAGKVLATLSPSDLFIGDMAFLLGDERTASVRAGTGGTLTELSKKEFVDSIREFPYYGLVLARILAKRLHNMNHLMAQLQAKQRTDINGDGDGDGDAESGAESDQKPEKKKAKSSKKPAKKASKKTSKKDKDPSN